MKITYDFHIHSVLSPCAEEEMTPNNIVNMALLKGLDVIAVTDHNSTENLRAIWDCAQGSGVVFVPGIEVETAEEVHVCCLFPDVDKAEEMGRMVKQHLMPIKNKPEILGAQVIMDSDDRCIAEETQMLLFASDLTIEQVFDLAESLDGCAYFAHVDRSTYSVLSVLGAFPEEKNFGVVEVSAGEKGRDFVGARHDLNDKFIIFASDSHRLADIGKGENQIELEPQSKKLRASDIIRWIKINNAR